MYPGGLPKEFVDILTPVQQRGEDGQLYPKWEKFNKAGPVPACVRFLSGNESRRGEQIEAVATHEISIRWLDGVTSAMRIKHGEKVYEIVSCGDPEGRRQWLTCLVAEVN